MCKIASSLEKTESCFKRVENFFLFHDIPQAFLPKCYETSSADWVTSKTKTEISYNTTKDQVKQLTVDRRVDPPVDH